MKKQLHKLALGVVMALIGSEVALAYPIDGYEYTGIRRLDFYDLAQKGVVPGRQLPAGAKLPLAEILPRKPALKSLNDVQPDADYNKALRGFLGKDADKYGVVILDLSDNDQPIYAEHNGSYKSNVGSVGKIIVGLGVLSTLAELHEDVGERENILRNTRMTADRFIERSVHEVPIWNVETRKLQHRPLRLGDEGSLWEYLDWMLSPSSNAAASMNMKELLLMRNFGEAYPVAGEELEAYVKQIGPQEFTNKLLPALDGPLIAAGLDTDSLRQGSFFTHYGKSRTGGTTSYATPRELLKLLLLMERAELVDEFTSRELKRLLYITQRRIRYASHPALNDSAVYFKSGSLYSCQPEPGFKCGKYMGNKRNTLASVAIVETKLEDRDLHYMVVVISNVLRVNSAVAHQTLALRIHRMIEARQAAMAAAKKE